MLAKAHFYIAGKFTSRDAWIHPKIAIGETELIVVTRGCVKIEEDGIRYDLHPGDALFLEPHLVHFGYERSVETVSFYWVHFTDVSIRDIPGLQKHFTIREPNIVSILCQNILHFSGMGASGDVCNRLLYVLLYELQRQNIQENAHPPLSHRVKEWIRLNVANDPTPAEVATAFGYSEGYITVLCKKEFGKGLKALITEQRIAYIKRLLLDSDKSAAELAVLCGFADSALFIKYFKYHTGMTPSAFRNTYYAIFSNSK